MNFAEKILDLILVVLPFIIKLTNNKKETIVKFRTYFDSLESKIDSANLSNIADEQIKELLDENTKRL